ncbi:MAG TPA: FKBP-type peptidyl-prolyl cis-trans isomerase [Mucilaginibacter sp.]|jgi:FKBP-type peptidyl-prolyl cis-trans isomerase|nr:FKBP-type peptidyl-prolyl cis-trans isomerase [Mucilaginibacter sp.]
MKKTIYPFLVIFVIGIILATGLPSCRKDKIELNIKQYDSVQIQNYMASHGLTGFIKDTTGGDTSGIYYKILVPGSGTPIQYSDKLAMVYTEETFDGTYSLQDTTVQHFYDFVGHIQEDGYPSGLQIAVHNLLLYPNASMRVLIPSHLAYGTAGKGSGSSQVANNKIGGNDCLDMYVHAITRNVHSNTTDPALAAYDDVVIQNYIKANSLTGYTKTADGLYYSVLTSATTNDPIQTYSTITATYTGQLFDGTIFDGSHNGTNTLSAVMADLIPGVQEGLINYAVAGTKISLLIPSQIGYGVGGSSGIPAFNCLRFTWQIVSVTP